MKDMTVMSLKIDRNLKESAQKTAAEFGLPLGTMINALLREIVRTRTFTVSLEERPSAWLKNEIAEGKKDYANGDYETATTVEELDAIFKSWV